MLVTITSAIALSSKQAEEIKKAIKSKHSQGKLEFKQVIDPQVLGGLSVTIGSKKYDSTVRAKLDYLQTQIYQQL